MLTCLNFSMPSHGIPSNQPAILQGLRPDSTKSEVNKIRAYIPFQANRKPARLQTAAYVFARFTLHMGTTLGAEGAVSDNPTLQGGPPSARSLHCNPDAPHGQIWPFVPGAQKQPARDNKRKSGKDACIKSLFQDRIHGYSQTFFPLNPTM